MLAKEDQLPQTDPEIIAALRDPGFYPHSVERVEHIQTHISHLFLTGDLAYKLKKPLDLGFLDFSTLERRVHYCREELELNRRLAPETYRRVAAVVRGRQGLGWAPVEEAGEELAEPVVEMAQMDRSRQMDLLLKQGRVDEEQVRELARLLADFYQRARGGPEVARFGRPAQVAFNVEENFRQTEDYREVTVAPARWRAIRDYQMGFLDRRRELFLRRVAEGRIVDGHGDLHSGNIVLPAGGRPIVFDCIEFNQRFRYQDAACDLAFLAMDLDYHGRPGLRRALVEEYQAASGDQGLAEILEFYQCYRAVVRAKIYGFELDDASVEPEQKFTDLGKARAYFRLAAGYAGGEPPFFLVCFCGLMGAGKSHLARALCRRRGWLRLSSDRVRKALGGRAPGAQAGEDWGRGLYGPEMNERVYDELLAAACARLGAGDSVVVDASFREDGQRRRFLQEAEALGARALLVEVRASREVAARRLAERQASGESESEGRLELYDRQARAWEEASDFVARRRLLVDGADPAEDNVARIAQRLAEPAGRQGGERA
jgi:hypothetical protein